MFDFLTVLIPFLLIHILGDFYLQPTHWVAAKKQRTYRAPQLYFHALLHGVGLIVPAMLLQLDWGLTLCAVAIVAVSHFFIDLWKVTTPNGEKLAAFVIDQTLHLLVLIALAFYIAEDASITAMLQHPSLPDVVMVLFAYLLILKPTSVIIASVLKNYPITSSANNYQINGLVAGGELIGYLERVLILTFTLVGSYAAVGIVLAAKSIFRFGELSKSKDRSMTEYVLIGSLISVVITTVVGTVVSLTLGIAISE